MNNSGNQSSILIQITTRNNNVEIYHVLCIIITVVAFLANSSLCLLYTCFKKVRRTNNIFLITHYIANTLQSLTATVLFAWPSKINALVCVLNVSFSCSVLCIPVISLVTLFKTKWDSRRQVCLSGNLSYVVLAVMLSAGVGVAIPPFLGWGSPILIFEYSTSTSISYSLFFGSCLIVVPLIAICFTNYKLFSRVRTYERRARREAESHCSGFGHGRVKCEPRRREGEAKWVAILQIVAFFVCLFPITVENVLASFIPQRMPVALKYSVNCIALAYFAMSPILYGLTNREVRQAFKCCCYQKTFVLQERPRKQRKGGKIGEGCYRIGTKNEAFVIQQVEQSCDELTGGYDLDCAVRERLVRFVGISTELSTGVEVDEGPRPQKPAIKEKRPITTEVSPMRRHSTLRKQDEAPKRRRKVDDDTKVHFRDEYTDKERKRYIATPSVKRMRQIKNSMSSMSETDHQSSMASLTGYELESQQHRAPHFTNYSDPMRSAGVRQVLTGKGKMARTCSLHRDDKYKPNIRKFIERRSSTEGDNAIRTGNKKRTMHGKQTKFV